MDHLFFTVDYLIDQWFKEPNLVNIYMQHEIALSVDFELICALEAKDDGLIISTGCDREIVLEFPLIAVVN